MPKLVLDFEALSVESFETDEVRAVTGTVAANQLPLRTGNTVCWEATCDAACDTGNDGLCMATLPYCEQTQYPVCTS